MKCNLVNENYKENYVENLLKSRGVLDFQNFMNPSRDCLQSPLNLKNIRMGAVLYNRIVNQPNAHILIVVDSDCDGFTSAAILYQYTKRLNPNVQLSYFLHEGKQHGLQDHINRILEEGIQYDLICLPDSSSNDAKYHDMLNDVKTPCLILDHHLTDVPLSDNAVVINNQLSPNYTNKELTGAGVVYQFCRYIDSLTGNNFADDYMDLAAWGIIGDMGSIIDIENRYIISTGLDIEHIKSPFLKALLEKQAYSITGEMSASWDKIVEKTSYINVAFYIVPLINALIRVGTMEEKELLFKAFIDGNQMVPCNKRGCKGTLEKASIEAARVCTNAKSHQNKMKEEISARLEQKIAKYDLLSNKVLFIRLDDEDNFPSELNGLLAMQLSVKYKRPTIIARLNEEGFDRGSARGLNQSELKDFRQFLLETGLFEYAQGHANAFGISIPNNKLAAFHEYANEALKNIDFGENYYDVNFQRDVSDEDLMQLILELGAYTDIWGQANSEPMIDITNIKIKPEDIRVMGTNQDTLKIESNGISFIKFKAKDMIQELKNKSGVINLEIVGKANINVWCGRRTPQVFIEEYEISPTLEYEKGYEF